ncbi:ATP-binding protein [Georgenia sp. Z1491]|uniref:sensor histidine kinase n=1 Tax=Georgenia sp. Z1491 TaxID=3416707 RepID=UPI003CE8B3DC
MHALGRRRGTPTPREGLSLSARLVVATVLLLGLGLGLAGATVIAVLRSQLVDQLDDNLHDTVDTIAQQDLEDLRSGGDQVVPTRYVVSIALEGESTQTVAHPRTSSVVGLPVLPDEPTTHPTSLRGTDPAVTWRALALPLVNTAGDQVGVLTISTPMDELSATVQQTGKYVVLISVSLVVLGATGGYLLIRHELRDLRAIERTAGAIAAGDLTRRVAPGAPGTEIGSLSSSLNSMLAQIERAFAARSASERRMRRFVADASHELRTPLATVRGYAELHRMGGVPESEVPAAMGRIEAEARRMGTLVEDLLTLARIDEDRRLTLSDVDVTDLARDAVRDLRALDPTRRATLLPLPGASGPTVARADADQLRQVFANLVGNAVRHTPEGTDVEILVGLRRADPAAPPAGASAAPPVGGSAAPPAGASAAPPASGSPSGGPIGGEVGGPVGSPVGSPAPAGGPLPGGAAPVGAHSPDGGAPTGVWAATGQLGPLPDGRGDAARTTTDDAARARSSDAGTGGPHAAGPPTADPAAAGRPSGDAPSADDDAPPRGTDARAASRAEEPEPTVPRQALRRGGDRPAVRVPDRRLLGLLAGRSASSVPTAALPEHAPEQDEIVLRVQDHGPGIPAEEAGRVFTRFYRIDRSRARSAGGGSGLGLAIVASVAGAHGGSARVLPTPGGGTTVELTLPVAGPSGGMLTGDEQAPVAV